MAEKELTYSEAMAQIEAILERFRTQEMDVDSLTQEVERAQRLIAQCRERLERVQSEVAKIVE